MTDAALRALLAAATPRPWTEGPAYGRAGDQVHVVNNGLRIGAMRTTPSTVMGYPKDRALIVAVVNALPALLDAVDALEDAKHHFPTDKNDALRFNYEDDEDIEDGIAMRTRIDAILARMGETS